MSPTLHLQPRHMEGGYMKQPWGITGLGGAVGLDRRAGSWLPVAGWVGGWVGVCVCCSRVQPAAHVGPAASLAGGIQSFFPLTPQLLSPGKGAGSVLGPEPV